MDMRICGVTQIETIYGAVNQRITASEDFWRVSYMLISEVISRAGVRGLSATVTVTELKSEYNAAAEAKPGLQNYTILTIWIESTVKPLHPHFAMTAKFCCIIWLF